MPFPRLRTTLLAAACVLAATHARATDDPKKAAPRQTLQEFLEHLRQMRDGVQTQISGTVNEILEAMESEAAVRRIQGLEEQRDKLAALGSEMVPLVVDQIEPGQNSTDPQKLRAAYVTQVLVSMPTRSITDKLIEICRSGSLEGKRNALKVLSVTPEPERVTPLLAQLFRGSQGLIRQNVLTALVKLGGPECEKVLSESLADSNSDIVKFVLQALGDVHGSAYAPRVQRLLQGTREAAQYSEVLLGFYRACPETVDKTVIQSFLHIAEDVGAPRDVRVKVLDGLSSFGDRFDSETKKEVRALTQNPEREIKEGALVLLVLVGDRSARKELLSDYDEQIDRNRNWANSWEQRAAVLYRIGDYRESQSDYLKAINLAKDDVKANLDQAYVGLARCQARQNKLKDAFQTLERAPISLKQLAELAKEPVFQKLLENPKYRGVFKID